MTPRWCPVVRGPAQRTPGKASTRERIFRVPAPDQPLHVPDRERGPRMTDTAVRVLPNCPHFPRNPVILARDEIPHCRGAGGHSDLSRAQISKRGST
jgi:hypothetical protein